MKSLGRKEKGEKDFSNFETRYVLFSKKAMCSLSLRLDYYYRKLKLCKVMKKK